MSMVLTSFSQTRIGYYYKYDNLTSTFSDMSGQDITSYGITSALGNSVKRDSLSRHIKRYRAKYPEATIKVVISTDTSIYTVINNIKNFEKNYNVKFDGYNLEREFWNGAGTFAQWQSWIILIKQRLGSVEAYLGKFSQAQSDSIIKYCDKINLHNYYTIDKWSGKFCLDNDNSRIKYLATSAYRKSLKTPGFTYEVVLLVANNEKENPEGFQTKLLKGDVLPYCFQSYKTALDASTISYKNKLIVQSIQVYKKQ